MGKLNKKLLLKTIFAVFAIFSSTLAFVVGGVRNNETSSSDLSTTNKQQRHILKAPSSGSLTVTYDIKKRNLIDTVGTAPTGSSVAFVNSYSSDIYQMNAGYYQTLTLNGYSKVKITKVILNMRSNGSSGAGNLTYATDGGNEETIVPTNNFSDPSWGGSYSIKYALIEKM